jgi:hypothetical protein
MEKQESKSVHYQGAVLRPFLSRQIYVVELPIVSNAAGSGENPFKDAAAGSLLNPGNTSDMVVIRAVEVYTAEIYAVAPSGNTVVDVAQAANLVLTLRVGEDQPIYQVPILAFVTQLNFGIVKELFPSNINLLKSGVTAIGTIPTNLSVMFGFHYERLTAAEFEKVQNAYPIPEGGLQNVLKRR